MGFVNLKILTRVSDWSLKESPIGMELLKDSLIVLRGS
jgi:hypothetical protein